MKKPKLCYVLPKYDANAPEHFVHTLRLLELLSDDLDIFLIIEKSIGTLKSERFKTVTQKFLGWPRAFELLFWLIIARLKGYRKLYVHYSMFAGILGGALYRLSGGQSYYWHCGLVKKFFLPFKFKIKNIKSIFLMQWPLQLTFWLIKFVVTGTDSMARYYSEEFGLNIKKMIVIPNDIDLKSFILNKNVVKDENSVLFIHHLSARKGVLHLPGIIQKVCSVRPHTRFLIGGKGPEQDYLKQKIDALNLAKQVKLLGPIPNPEVKNYYAASSVFLMPSEEEGFPRVLIESMAMGVPYVASRVGGVADISPPEMDEYLLDPKNEDLFADKIVELLDNKSKAQKLSQLLKAHVVRYDALVVKQIFIEKVMGQ